jgi:coatomer subunit beta'
MEKIKDWEAHADYIRYVEVHPNRPLILTTSDDLSIKMWDWEKDFECTMWFEGHCHYVMMVRVNPRDTNTFASASLDKTIKVWGLTSSTPHFSLEGAGAHEKGVNCIDYYPGGDKPYLLSGADDRTVKIWDYQTKACLQTLEGHSHNVASVCFHPRLPLIVSASEDGTVRLWHSTTYRPETTLNYGMDRAWTLSPTKDENKLAIGFDEGTVVLKLGNERPVASLDINAGKLVWALSHDIQTMSVRGLNKEGLLQDGDRVTLSARDLGACEVFPQSLKHNSNGSFVCVCGDGEYIIYTSQALRNKAYGSALDFVWSAMGSGDFAIRESGTRVRTFKNFKDHKQIALPMSSAERIFGGACLGVQGPDCVVFFDWSTGAFIRKIDVAPSQVLWNEGGDTLILVCEDTYYVLKFDAELVAHAVAAGGINPEEGVDGSFELDCTINDAVHTGQWVGDCFLYTNGSGKLNYFVGGEVITLCHLNAPMYLLGYVPKEDRVFLIDKAYNVVSYKLLLSVLNYQTAVVRRDFDTANSLLPSIPQSEHAAVARFLESQGFKEEALAVSTDMDHRFELAIDLKNLEAAKKVLQDDPTTDVDSTDYQNRWRRLGDLALNSGDIELAQSCATKSGDLSGMLLIYAAAANKEGMLELAELAKERGRTNVAFLAYFVTGRVEKCIDLLVDTKRVPEAAFMARTYMPSKITEVLGMWKDDLKSVNEKAADSLADPEKYPNLFPDLDWALKIEKMFLQARETPVPAAQYSVAKAQLDLNLIDIVKAQAAAGNNVEEMVSGSPREEVEAVAPKPEEPVVETPESAAAPAPVPEPAAAPVPEPAAAPVPEPTAAPVPEPTAAPVPDPAAVPVPEPVAVSVPVPASAPVAAPAPAPESVTADDDEIDFGDDDLAGAAEEGDDDLDLGMDEEGESW